MDIRAKSTVLAALLAALTAAGALLSVPLPPPLPPVTLAVFFALMSGLLLGPLWGAASMGLYLFLGTLGLPVFASGAGGLGHFATPTGGFLLGYLAAAVVAGILSDRREWKFPRALSAALAGVAALYVVGVPWFQSVVDAIPDRDMSLVAAIVAMLPYLAGDVVKAVAAALLVRTLAPLLKDYLPPPTGTAEPPGDEPEAR